MFQGAVSGPVLLTGAASGIGRAVARSLSAAGVPLALVDRDAAGLARVRDALTAAPGAAGPAAGGVAAVSVLPVDVSDASAMAAAFAQAVADLGPLAGVVSAAGVLVPGGLDDVSDADWEHHLRVNAGGVLHCLRGASTHVRDHGSVVVVGSNAARVPRTGMIAYAASKAAAAAATRAAGLELAGRGVRCNVVEPGSTDTPMQQALWPDPDAGRQAALRGDPAAHRLGIPLGRIAAPEDVAAVVCFLLSPAARHVTLQQMYVDGGASL